MPRISRPIRYGVLGCFLLWGAACCAQAERPTIALRPGAVVDTAEVFLGQVADIEAPAELRERLSQVSLGTGPLPGTRRLIPVAYLKLRLRRHGIDPATVVLTGESVVVTCSRELPAVAPRPGSATVVNAAGPLPGGPSAPAPLVKRNQLVELQIQCGAIVIHTTGRANSDAAEGELVKLSLEGSTRGVIAKVTGPGQAVCIIARSTP